MRKIDTHNLKVTIAVIILLVLIFFISGCTNKPIVMVEDIEQFHPARPLPIQMITPEWKMLTPSTVDSYIKDDEQYTYMAITWEDYLMMGQNMQSIIKYLKDNNVLLCYYRKDLKEPQCIEDTK